MKWEFRHTHVKVVDGLVGLPQSPSVWSIGTSVEPVLAMMISEGHDDLNCIDKGNLIGEGIEIELDVVILNGIDEKLLEDPLVWIINVEVTENDVALDLIEA